VGQGDSILIQSAGEFMLIDTGENSQYSKLSSYLEQFGVSEFKYVVLTHPHSDHIGSAHRIVSEYDIEKLIMPSIYHDTQTFANLLDAMDGRSLAPTRAEAGASYQFGDAEFIILAPMSEEYANLNNYSAVILMKYGNTKFLFTGDMERESENEIMRQSLENNLDISADVLKVAHHGSNSSSQTSFLDLIRPALAVIQVGEGNTHSHPNMQVISNLEDTGAEILRTDWHGDIIIISNGRSLAVRASKGGYDGRFAADLDESY
jgi:beta-lactamase superfamily II metal-dependent hydrolase